MGKGVPSPVTNPAETRLFNNPGGPTSRLLVLRYNLAADAKEFAYA
jgi:hypothetical protein